MKSLIKREEKHSSGFKMKTRDLYKQITEDRSIPDVPIHMMDDIQKNLALHLLEIEQQRRIPMSEWRKKSIMLPILNTSDR